MIDIKKWLETRQVTKQIQKAVMSEFHKTLADAKQKELERFSTQNDLNFDILQDLVNSAANGVNIEIYLRDGTRIHIRQKDDFEKMLQGRKEVDEMTKNLL